MMMLLVAGVVLAVISGGSPIESGWRALLFGMLWLILRSVGL
jgi:VIT1/CCC1 family predicted Fe2+/Mn2+ transporter